MRRQFHPLLLDHMRRDPRIRLITPDLGYKMLDSCFEAFPERCVNCGAAEQLALGIAVGLADDGLIPVVYSITPFLLFRPAEWIRTYLGHENSPVKLLGAGRYENGKECYGEDGFSHAAKGDHEFLGLFPNIVSYWPQTIEELPTTVEKWLYNKAPSYLNLRR